MQGFRCVVECNYLPSHESGRAMAPCSHVLRRLLTVAGDKRKVLSLSEDKTVYFEVASISRVRYGGRQTALITRLRVQTVLQSCEYASKA